MLLCFLQLKLQSVAPYAWLDSNKVAGVSSDNGFKLLAWADTTITFKGIETSKPQSQHLACKLSPLLRLEWRWLELFLQISEPFTGSWSGIWLHGLKFMRVSLNACSCIPPFPTLFT